MRRRSKGRSIGDDWSDDGLVDCRLGSSSSSSSSSTGNSGGDVRCLGDEDLVLDEGHAPVVCDDDGGEGAAVRGSGVSGLGGLGLEGRQVHGGVTEGVVSGTGGDDAGEEDVPYIKPSGRAVGAVGPCLAADAGCRGGVWYDVCVPLGGYLEPRAEVRALSEGVRRCSRAGEVMKDAVGRDGVDAVGIGRSVPHELGGNARSGTVGSPVASFVVVCEGCGGRIEPLGELVQAARVLDSVNIENGEILCGRRRFNDGRPLD